MILDMLGSYSALDWPKLWQSAIENDVNVLASCCLGWGDMVLLWILHGESVADVCPQKEPKAKGRQGQN